MKSFVSLSLILFALESSLSADIVQTLRDLDTHVLSDRQREQYEAMVARDIERRRLQAIARENEAWSQVETRDDWERFRDQRIDALRRSLGAFPPAAPLPLKKAGQAGEPFRGDGFEIHNIIFPSRSGWFVAANLYLPTQAEKPVPAFVFSHSHHAPKTHGELQDMGMTWARNGWAVLVMDHPGHGERRQHPFTSSDDYPQPFRVGRQDYYFRYNTGLQLQLAGESLMGWMVWDLKRCVDVLCAREDIDQNRIIMIGSVAGGGDPAAVAAALDARIAAVAPFNFGGPQPDYPIPAEANETFDYFGVAHWETTRCLRLGGRDGFAHWTIVGAVAPRRLIYSSEFGWERDRDPVWPRLEKVFGFYDARDHLAVAQGRGQLKGRPPESTHCGNVGVYHRRQFYPHLERWFGMAPPTVELQQRRETQELMCWTPAARKQLQPQPIHRLASQLAETRASDARRQQRRDPRGRRARLRTDWSKRLGNIEPHPAPTVIHSEDDRLNEATLERVLLKVEDHIVVPLTLLRHASIASPRTTRPKQPEPTAKQPVVVMFARSGKQKLTSARASQIAELLAGGAAVCLPDLRGIGETSAGEALGRRSTNTTLSCRDEVLGQTMLGARLRDLRSVLQYIRSRKDLGAICLWGDSLAEPNPRDRDVAVPLGVSHSHVYAEPTGAMLALFGGLFEDDIAAIYAKGGLASFRSLLNSPFLYVPHDAVIPGAVTAGEVADLVAGAAPRPVRIQDFVDGVNRRVPMRDLQSTFAPATAAYRQAKHPQRLVLSPPGQRDAATWMLSQIAK